MLAYMLVRDPSKQTILMSIREPVMRTVSEVSMFSSCYPAVNTLYQSFERVNGHIRGAHECMGKALWLYGGPDLLQGTLPSVEATPSHSTPSSE